MASSLKTFFAVVLLLLGLVLIFSPSIIGLSVLPDCPNGQAELNMLQPTVAYTSISPSLGIHCYNDGTQVTLSIMPQSGMSAGWVVTDNDCSSGWCNIGSPVTYNQNPVTITVRAAHFYAVSAFFAGSSSSSSTTTTTTSTSTSSSSQQCFLIIFCLPSTTTSTTTTTQTNTAPMGFTLIAGVIFMIAGIVLLSARRES